MYECSAALAASGSRGWAVGVAAIGLAVAGNRGCCAGEWGVMSGAVIGRDAELDLVQSLLDEVGGGPVGLVLSGEPGIGKTILWQAGVDEARRTF